MRPGLPRLSRSSASMYYTERKPKNKKRGRPGNKAIKWGFRTIKAPGEKLVQHWCLFIIRWGYRVIMQEGWYIEEDELFNFFIALQNFLAFENRLHNFSMWAFLALRRFDTSLLRWILYFSQDTEVLSCFALLKRTFRLLMPFTSFLFSHGALLPIVEVARGIHSYMIS